MEHTLKEAITDRSVGIPPGINRFELQIAGIPQHATQLLQQIQACQPQVTVTKLPFWSTAHLEALIVVQIMNIFYNFHTTRNFIIAFTKAATGPCPLQNLPPRLSNTS